MEDIKINVFDDRSLYDETLVDLLVEDVPKEYDLNKMLSHLEKELNELIGEDGTEELFFHNDLNWTFWFDVGKQRNFALHFVLLPEDSEDLIKKLMEVSGEEMKK